MAIYYLNENQRESRGLSLLRFILIDFIVLKMNFSSFSFKAQLDGRCTENVSISFSNLFHAFFPSKLFIKTNANLQLLYIYLHSRPQI